MSRLPHGPSASNGKARGHKAATDSGGRGGRERGAAPRLDAANLAGLTSLMNPQHLRAGLTGPDLDAAEKAVMGRNPGASGRTPAETDPVRQYTSELNQLAEELGIDLLDEGDQVVPRAPAPGDAPRAAGPGRDPAGPGRARGPVTGRIADLVDELDLGEGAGSTASASRDSDSGGEDGDSGSYSDESRSGRGGADGASSADAGASSRSSGSASGSRSGGSRGGGSRSRDADSVIDRLEADLGIRTDGRRERRRRRLRHVDLPHAGRHREPHLTDEQERRRHINSVVADIRGETRTTFGVERERLQDHKASKLEQIGQLRLGLTEEGIDCSAVGNPTADSPMEEIDSVLRILRLKNDRNRCSTLAEEVIIGGAEFVETVFDGTRTVPLLGWRPDYTGYHNTVTVKLHRMRFETAQIVGNIIEKYNLGSTARIALELLPSFFLYPHQQKKQRGTPGLASDPHVADARPAYAAIREADRPKDLDDVLRI